MKKLNSKKVIFIVILAVLLVVGVAVGYSFAYFTASVVNDSTINNTVVTTAALEIEFTDGPKVSLENATPGQEREKTFKIKNNSSLDTTYDIYMSEVINTFVDKSDLVYTLESADGGANITSETVAPDTPTKIVSSHILGGDEEHNYKLKIKFKETNDNQDDNKEKQFDVTIRINEVFDSKKSAVDTIKEIVKDENENSTDVINKGSKDGCTYTLAYDGTSDNNLRYVGKNPCNFISYNNELWRIVGVMNNIENSAGQTSSLLKIRKIQRLENYSWDTSDSSTNYGNGINQWGTSESYDGADLMKELNYDYLGITQVGTDGYWYNGNSNNKTAFIPSSTIGSNAQAQLENVVWHLGSPNNDNDSVVPVNDNSLIASYVYSHERLNNTGIVCSGACSSSITRTTTWTGKVGLLYPSDYLYATAGGSTVSRNNCLNTKMYMGWNNYSNEDCRSNDWIYYSTYSQWTISPVASTSSEPYEVFAISSSGGITNSGVYSDYSVYPTLHLKSSVSITSGSGTSSDPYILG